MSDQVVQQRRIVSFDWTRDLGDGGGRPPQSEVPQLFGL